MNYRFFTRDHPQANGRQPEPGEVGIRLYFPLEDGGRLDVMIGEEGLRNLINVLAQYQADEEAGVFEDT